MSKNGFSEWDCVRLKHHDEANGISPGAVGIVIVSNSEGVRVQWGRTSDIVLYRPEDAESLLRLHEPDPELAMLISAICIYFERRDTAMRERIYELELRQADV